MHAEAGIARRLIIHGLVQGVWYRDSMRREAETLGVAGWVRNVADGSVEAWIEGDQAAVDAIIAWARRGPPRAQVSAVDISPAARAEYRGFAIL
jgi:acylphosphatase